MDSLQLAPNSKVLLLWSSQCAPEDVKSYAEQLGKDHQLQLENIERLQMGTEIIFTLSVSSCFGSQSRKAFDIFVHVSEIVYVNFLDYNHIKCNVSYHTNTKDIQKNIII